MTAAELIGLLDGVRSRGPHKWSARCPAHADKSPSLSISEGTKGMLLKCWAGCSLKEITGNLGIRISDLFFDFGIPDSTERRHAKHQRAQQRAEQAAAYEAKGRQLDLQRDAEAVIRAACDMDISRWTDEQLDSVLNRLADAYAIVCPTGE